MQLSSRSYKIPVSASTVTVHLDSRFGREGDFSAEKSTVGEHFHTQYELFFVTGRLTVCIEGECRSLTSGVLCLPPFTHHAVLLREGVYTLRITAREGEVAPPLSETVKELSLSEFAAGLLPRLSLAGRKESATADAEVEALLFLLFLDLYEENVQRPRLAKLQAIDDYCSVIDHYVHVHYAEPVTLKTVAEALHLSTKQVSRIISGRYHSTLSALLNEKRLQVAAELLLSTELSVGAIAGRVFGRSENYFYRLFREKYGLSPLAYRKKARQEKGLAASL